MTDSSAPVAQEGPRTMTTGRPPSDLVQRNDDGSLTQETLKRAMNACRRRLKLTREDDEARLGHDAMTKGRSSAIVGIKPPEQYPQEVWDEHLPECLETGHPIDSRGLRVIPRQTGMLDRDTARVPEVLDLVQDANIVCP